MWGIGASHKNGDSGGRGACAPFKPRRAPLALIRFRSLARARLFIPFHVDRALEYPWRRCSNTCAVFNALTQRRNEHVRDGSAAKPDGYLRGITASIRPHTTHWED